MDQLVLITNKENTFAYNGRTIHTFIEGINANIIPKNISISRSFTQGLYAHKLCDIPHRITDSSYYIWDVEIISKPDDLYLYNAVIRLTNMREIASLDIWSSLDYIHDIISTTRYGMTFLRYCHNLSFDIQQKAIDSNAHNIQYINNPDLEIIKLAINKNGHVIQHIFIPTTEMIIMALSNDGNAIKYINNPTLEMVKIALKQNIKSVIHINDSTLLQSIQDLL